MSLDELLKSKENLKLNTNMPLEQQFTRFTACAYIIWGIKIMEHIENMMGKSETFSNTKSAVGSLLDHYKSLGKKGDKNVEDDEKSLNTAFKDIQEYIGAASKEFSSAIKRGKKEIEAGIKYKDNPTASSTYSHCAGVFKEMEALAIKEFSEDKRYLEAACKKYEEIKDKRAQKSYHPQKVTRNLKPLRELLTISNSFLFLYPPVDSYYKNPPLISSYSARLSLYALALASMDPIVECLLDHYKKLDKNGEPAQSKDDQKRIASAFDDLPEWVKVVSEDFDRCAFTGEAYTNEFKAKFKNSTEDTYKPTIQGFYDSKKRSTDRLDKSRKRLTVMHAAYRKIRREMEDRKEPASSRRHRR